MDSTSKSAAHTPGPWFMDTSLHIYGNEAPVETEGFPGVRTIAQPHVATATTFANAALIAAAPDLLAALRELLDHVEAGCVTEGDCNAARAAIARAEGRS